MMTQRSPTGSSFIVPDRCSDCRRRFDKRDSHRQIRTLEGQFALCSDCTWHLMHPDEARR
jgi:hypothetical protein